MDKRWYEGIKRVFGDVQPVARQIEIATKALWDVGVKDFDYHKEIIYANITDYRFNLEAVGRMIEDGWIKVNDGVDIEFTYIRPSNEKIYEIIMQTAVEEEGLSEKWD